MVTIEKLANGLTVMVEEMPHVQSVAYELMFPGGIITDDQKFIGASLLLGELTTRGAGTYDSMEPVFVTRRAGGKIATRTAACCSRKNYRSHFRWLRQ